MKRRSLGVVAVAALTTLITACGGTQSSTPAPGTSSAAAYPVTVGSVTLAAQPNKIVSLSPTLTEMLFAIGAGKQVVAADEHSTYPADAPKTELSGFDPNAEAVAAYQPDLVVLSNDTKNIVAQLKALNIPVYLAPAAVTMDDSYRQLAELGQLTGHADQGKAVGQQIKDEIAKLVKDLPKRNQPLTYYYELDPSLYSVTSKTFIGSLFTMAGLNSVADAAGKDGSGYPQLNAEALVKANPDMIFLADTKCCGQSPDTVKARPGWSNIAAVSKGQIIALDDEIASRWGPRIVELVRAIVDAVNKVPA